MSFSFKLHDNLPVSKHEIEIRKIPSIPRERYVYVNDVFIGLLLKYTGTNAEYWGYNIPTPTGYNSSRLLYPEYQEAAIELYEAMLPAIEAGSVPLS